MTGKILVVDDQPDLLSGIKLTLESVGYDVLAASDGINALQILAQETVDLIITDIAMPRMNGYQLFERVRENENWIAIPFLFLTARSLDSDVRYGKELGVDDYLTKPLEPEDLLATVAGRLRRAQQLSRVSNHAQPLEETQSTTLTVGELQIDPGQHRAWMSGESIQLSAREFTLLEFLVSQRHRISSPEELIQITHGFSTDHIEAGSLLRPLIRSLRRKMGFPVGETGYIDNVRGVGYRLAVPEEPQ